eukprot:m.33868 g.33868  ORF g.33868 m.33868 type:complete len:276 (-) comp16883_c0_seq1:10-837(-)
MSEKEKYAEVPLIESPTPHGGCRFKGKTIVLTACTKGLGFAIAMRLGQEGGKLVISSRKQDAVDEALKILRSKGIEAVGIASHQAKASDREKLIKLAVSTFGAIDCVVLCAGTQPAAATLPTLEVESSLFDKIFDVNVKSFWEFVKDVKPHLNKAGANFVFVSSEAAFSPRAPLGLYGVSKTALVSLTKLLAGELGSEGIRVNCLAPGLVRTRFSELLWKTNEGAQLKSVERSTILGRAADPWEMAGAVAFMCSDDSSYMSGETMLINGGSFARL